ncbi:glycine--tRNA ligase subunit beta [Ketobacter alkanivorans]|uniref:Glycine--tRNA ligase beta subunit n=1 Tax=Ketobacter alkanivorans TaxID=1917421 RepID=A0A2K9LLK7_9GAMM|nr:glycine--tRNA ligase subunit beta [Ketobacter alkanivorans]AUM13061.1 glycine--tRNA ligase subunit beta [Ketobacter alkanivorans]
MSTQDFLVELGTEELPPKALKKLSQSFCDGIVKGLASAGLPHGDVHAYAAPRRLAVLVKALSTQQPDCIQNIDGPPVKAAFDADGQPTKAALGFARKNGVEVDQLDRSGAKLRYVQEVKGNPAKDLLPDIVAQSLNDLPIPKRMRWGASRVEFVRPTQWLVMLLGNDVVECEILAQKAGHESRGHRFHHPEKVRISAPANYLEDMRAAWVIADFEERRTLIQKRVHELAAKENGIAIVPDELLDEVTALVEWPVPLVCSFEERFLAVPQEALILTMQDNQKYFCLLDANQKLLPRFITVANLESTQPEFIVEGNEKVVRPRLNDAEFFFKQDKKNTLESHNQRLQNVVFQAELGSVYDKAARVAKLAGYIARTLGSDAQLAERAGLLSKCDLSTEMVGEFPELQGIMGTYYARHDGEHDEVALALNEQYQPRFAGDALPSTVTGQAVAVAEKVDTLIGILGIGKHPTGDKDPFALRRAALGALRIIVGKELALDLVELASEAIAAYGGKLTNADVQTDFLNFMNGRYQTWFVEEGISIDIIKAVLAVNRTQPLDFYKRAKAVQAFKQLPQAEALAAANKRVGNILSKRDQSEPLPELNQQLLQDQEEQTLASAVALHMSDQRMDYPDRLQSLAALREPVDAFFEKVMVNVEDIAVRNNRLALLKQLHDLFLDIADIAELQ